MFHGIGILLILVQFIVIVILLTIFWRIASALDLASRSLSDIARDLRKLADKGEEAEVAAKPPPKKD